MKYHYKKYTSESGGILVILLILITILLTLIATLSALLWAHYQSYENLKAYTKAFYFAEAGIEYSLAKGLVSANSMAIDEGHFSVQVFRLNNTTYRIKSTGVYGNKSRYIYVTIRKSKKRGSENNQENKNRKYQIVDWSDSYINKLIL